MLRWHDETLRALFAEHRGDEVVATGDGFFVGLRLAGRGARVRGGDPAAARRAPPAGRVRAEGADRRARDRRDAARAELHSGKGVHEASRIAGLAEGGQIVASKETAAGSRFPVSNAQTVTLRGTSEPVDVVTVEWH